MARLSQHTLRNAPAFGDDSCKSRAVARKLRPTSAAGYSQSQRLRPLHLLSHLSPEIKAVWCQHNDQRRVTQVSRHLASHFHVAV